MEASIVDRTQYLELILQVTIGVFGSKKQVWKHRDFCPEIHRVDIFKTYIYVPGTCCRVAYPLHFIADSDTSFHFKPELLLIKVTQIRAATTSMQTLHGSI